MGPMLIICKLFPILLVLLPIAIVLFVNGKLNDKSRLQYGSSLMFGVTKKGPNSGDKFIDTTNSPPFSGTAPVSMIREEPEQTFIDSWQKKLNHNSEARSDFAYQVFH